MSDGALCVFLDGYTGREGKPVPLIIRKSDGGYGYATTDLATIRHRVERLGADRCLYVIGAPQALHLEMVWETARLAGWLPDHVEVVHVQIGNVLGEDRKILRTRSGAPLRLMALLEEAEANARREVDASRPELPEEVRAAIAPMVGIGAVKYADLSVAHDSEYVFDLDRMLAFVGNTGPYLQYATARIHSIFRSAGVAAGVRRRDHPRRAGRARAGPATAVLRDRRRGGRRHPGAAPALHLPLRPRPGLLGVLRALPGAQGRDPGAARVAALAGRAHPRRALPGARPARDRDARADVSRHPAGRRRPSGRLTWRWKRGQAQMSCAWQR